jgi:hypothetical protein
MKRTPAEKSMGVFFDIGCYAYFAMITIFLYQKYDKITARI